MQKILKIIGLGIAALMIWAIPVLVIVMPSFGTAIGINPVESFNEWSNAVSSACNGNWNLFSIVKGGRGILILGVIFLIGCSFLIINKIRDRESPVLKKCGMIMSLIGGIPIGILLIYAILFVIFRGANVVLVILKPILSVIGVLIYFGAAIGVSAIIFNKAKELVKEGRTGPDKKNRNNSNVKRKNSDLPIEKKTCEVDDAEGRSDTPQKKAAICLAKSLHKKNITPFISILSPDISLIVYREMAFTGYKGVEAFFKIWMSKEETHKFKICFSPWISSDLLEIKNYRYGRYSSTTRIYFYINNTDHAEKNFLVNKIMFVDENDLDHPYINCWDYGKPQLISQLEWLKSQEKGMHNHLFCEKCGTDSPGLLWFNIQGYPFKGTITICPSCLSIVEKIEKVQFVDDNEKQRMLIDEVTKHNETLDFIYEQLSKENVISSPSPKGLLGTHSQLFYDRPLKDNDLLNGLDDSLYVSMFHDDLKTGYDVEDVDDPNIPPKSIRCCAEEFAIYHIIQLYTIDKDLFEQINNCYQTAAKNGIVEALNNLGVLYTMLGKEDEGLKYFELGVENNVSNSMINISLWHFHHQNIEKFVQYTKMASKANNPIGLYNHAVILLTGDYGEPKDTVAANLMFIEALKQAEKDTMIKQNALYNRALILSHKGFKELLQAYILLNQCPNQEDDDVKNLKKYMCKVIDEWVEDAERKNL